MKNYPLATRGIAAACAVLCASSFAQTTPELKPIIVSASRMEQALQTAPVGASVILTDDIRASGALNANEAVRRLGGVVARSDLLGGRESAIDLRGFGDSAANNMVVVIDGVRISENELVSARLSAISAERIERIEIVRGGASVAWGEGATGGVIQIITKGSAPKGLSGSVQLGLESFGTRDVNANLDVGTEGVRYFAQLRSLNTNGYRANSDQKNDNVLLGLEAGSNQGLKARVEFFHDKQSSRLPGNLPIALAQVNPRQTLTPVDNASRNEDRLSAALQYRSGGWLTSFDLARRVRESTVFYDFGAGGTQEGAGKSHGTQLSPRLQYNGEWGAAAVTAQLGIDQQSWDFRNNVAFSGFAANAEVASQASRATFARLDVLLPSQTRIVTGLRNERISKDFSDSLAGSAYTQRDPLKAWELGLNQTLAPGWDAYVRTSRSYRVANVDENRFLLTPLKPQTARDAELGMRHLRKDASFGARIFRQSTQNEIAYDNNLFANVNLDPVRRSGLELEGQVNLNASWKLAGSLQNIRARFASGAYAGNRPPHVSATQLQARVTWLPAAAHRLELALSQRGNAIVGNDWSNACAARVPARNTLDLGYAYAPVGAGWSLSAGVDNLTDRKTFGWGFTNATCTATNVYPEAGRSFKLKARYSF